MKIGFSTSVIQRGKTGVAQYVFALLRALLARADQHEFNVFVLEEDLPLFDFAKVRMKLIPVAEKFRPAVKNVLWHQTGLPPLAKNLGLRYEILPIEPAFQAVEKQLAKVFAGTKPNEAEENVQSRLRGVTLMALSNKFGALVLTTGNKSEMAVGYCTLYGDMNGALAPIADVFKTDIYKIARWVNREREIIPAASITKPPSAELRPDQTDQDSLPPYEILDAILDAYVVGNLGREEIIRRGFAAAVVNDVVNKVNFSEYKRRQAAPGLKVSPRAFGMGRRIPIAQKFRAQAARG